MLFRSIYEEDTSAAQTPAVLEVWKCVQLARLVLCIHFFSYDVFPFCTVYSICTCVTVYVYACELNVKWMDTLIGVMWERSLEKALNLYNPLNWL